MDQNHNAPQEHEIEWTQTAQRSLKQIVQHIARDKPIAAENFRRRIFQIVGLLKRSPYLGRIVPEFRDPARRELLHGNYRIVYRLRPRLKKIQILVIWHGKRLLRLP